MSRLAVLCDPDGRIARVLLDEGALLADHARGAPLSWLLTDHSIGALYELFALLTDGSALCDWTLDVARPNGLAAYYLSAARGGDAILLAGGRSPFDARDWRRWAVNVAPDVAELVHRIAERADDPAAYATDLRRQIDALRAQTRSTDRLENALIRVAAHDLRNPILVMRMNCSYLLQHGELDEVARGVVGEMLETCHYMERYLGGMTSLSQIWQGALELQREPIDARAALGQIVEEFRDVAAVRDISVDLARADPLVVSGDVGKLTRVVHELLCNAATFCASGSRIEVQLVGHGQRARIHIDDNGPGIAATTRETLFQPFGKGPHSSPHGFGAGVGLPICRRIVEAHGGTLRVDSDGTGTRVTIELPAEPIVEATAEATAETTADRSAETVDSHTSSADSASR